jgi:hypothetical protein
MTIQFSVAVRNAQADAVETVTGAAPIFQLRSGAAPADCATADSGTLLVAITLPSDWLSAASAGAKTKVGTWTGTAAAAGTVGHFRIKDSAGSTTHMQGTAGISGTDIILDAAATSSIGQTVTINAFSYTRASA